MATVTIKRNWVSKGRGPRYDPPIVLDTGDQTPEEFMRDRAQFFAVIDETMNTHRDFVRATGQEGYIDTPKGRIWCDGWRSAPEIGVPYVMHPRYAHLFPEKG